MNGTPKMKNVTYNDDGSFAFGFTYGSDTEYWIGENQLRIGFEGPGRVMVALTTGEGSFPIRYLCNSKNQEEIVFASHKEAYEHLTSIADKIGAVKREQ
jgi:hypothetical protein